jgi:hypothetical protein
VVLDPFSGSGTTGLAAVSPGCSYVGFEIDPEQVAASNTRLAAAELGGKPGGARVKCVGCWPSGVIIHARAHVHTRKEAERRCRERR